MRNNLKEARKKAGLTQEQMAEKLGISLREYKNIEGGNSYGRIPMWDFLEDFFNVHQRVLRENHHDREDSQEIRQKNRQSQ